MLRNWQECLVATDAALEVSRRDFDLHALQVRCLAELGRTADAHVVFQAVERDFPKDADKIERLRRTLAAHLPSSK
jgi:hypothetical protein